MVTDSSNQPGWGAISGSRGGTTYGNSNEGTYTDASGNKITPPQSEITPPSKNIPDYIKFGYDTRTGQYIGNPNDPNTYSDANLIQKGVIDGWKVGNSYYRDEGEANREANRLNSINYVKQQEIAREQAKVVGMERALADIKSKQAKTDINILSDRFAGKNVQQLPQIKQNYFTGVPIQRQSVDRIASANKAIVAAIPQPVKDFMGAVDKWIQQSFKPENTHIDKRGYVRNNQTDKIVNPLSLRNVAASIYPIEKGFVEGIGTKPIETGINLASMFVISKGAGYAASKLPILVRGIGAGKVASKITPLNVVGGTVAVAYGADVAVRVGNAPDKRYKFGEILGTEIVPMAIGANIAKIITVDSMTNNMRTAGKVMSGYTTEAVRSIKGTGVLLDIATEGKLASIYKFARTGKVPYDPVKIADSIFEVATGSNNLKSVLYESRINGVRSKKWPDLAKTAEEVKSATEPTVKSDETIPKKKEPPSKIKTGKDIWKSSEGIKSGEVEIKMGNGQVQILKLKEVQKAKTIIEKNQQKPTVKTVSEQILEAKEQKTLMAQVHKQQQKTKTILTTIQGFKTTQLQKSLLISPQISNQISISESTQTLQNISKIVGINGFGAINAIKPIQRHIQTLESVQGFKQDTKQSSVLMGGDMGKVCIPGVDKKCTPILSSNAIDDYGSRYAKRKKHIHVWDVRNPVPDLFAYLRG